MNDKSNFRRGSVELLILHLLKQKDCYGYELSQIMKQQTDGVMDIPVGSLYPALYKLIDNGYISDYKKQVGRRMVRVYYHIEDAGQERLDILLNDYNQTKQAIQCILNYREKENPNGSKETKDSR